MPRKEIRHILILAHCQERVAPSQIRIASLLLLFWSPAMAKAELPHSGGEKPATRYADCHIHLVDFLQQGEFNNTDHYLRGSRLGADSRGRYPTLPVGQRWRRISALLDSMQKANVDFAMVCGLPVLKKWSEIDTFERPDGYLDNESHLLFARDTDMIIAGAILDYREKFAKDKAKLRQLKRISPFLCGIDPTDLGAVDLVVDRIQEFPAVWEGIGEIMSRHDDLTHLTLGERPRGNHPALIRVCEFAGIHFLPVAIHHNIAPVSARGRDRVPAYLDELVELFEKTAPNDNRPATVFIWCHAGASRRVHVDDLPYWIDEVLEKFGDRVYIDLSWVVLEEYILKEPVAWEKLVEKHPSNFMIGSDFVGGASGIGERLQEYDSFLAGLQPTTRRKVARDNFRALARLLADKRHKANLTRGDSDAIVLAPNYQFPEYKSLSRANDEDSFVRSRLDEQQD